MKNSEIALRRFAAAVSVAGLLFWMIACGGGSSTETVPGSGDTPKAPAFNLELTQAPVANGIVTARLAVTDATELYQLSARISYDPAQLHPVDSRRGGLVNEDATFFTTLKAGGYVPVAFTYHEGQPLPGASGNLAVIEFAVLDAAAAPQLGIVTDPEFLIARSASGADLEIGLGVAR